jgi:hypothetical protein
MENNTIPGRIALELDYNVGYCKMIKLWKKKIWKKKIWKNIILVNMI